MESDIKSPGPGWRYFRFSDGEGAWMNPKLTDQQIAQIHAQGEAERDAKYMAQAKAENRPITTVDKTYSATVARPSTPYGHLMAWIDHNLGGNTLNESSAGKAIVSAHDAVGTGARVATSAIEAEPHVRAIDLGLTGYNVGKHLLAKQVPGLDKVPDSQTILGLTQYLTGTPELPPDASMERRILENTASAVVGMKPSAAPTSFFGGLPSPGPTGVSGQILDQIGRASLSHIGGLAGEEVGGEAGQFGGSFFGGAPGSARAIAQRTLAPFFRGRETQNVSQAAARQGIEPSLGSVSNAMGRLFEKGLAATPFVGARVRTAQERFNDAIRQRQLEISEDVYGGPLPGAISDEDIGGALIRGARQGSANITQRAKDEQQQVIHGIPARPATGTTPAQPAQPGIGHNTGVQGRDVYYHPGVGYAGARLRLGPNEYPAYAARLDNIRQAAIQAQMPFWQNFWGQLQNGEIPFERFQRLRSAIGNDIEGFSGMDKGDQKRLYAAMTDAMREAARARGGQALVDRFDTANANYERLIGEGGQREKLEEIGGKPQSGEWDQFMGPQGQTRPAVGVEFDKGKDEQGAANWFKSKLRAPEALAPFADPTLVPNDYWRQVVGLWLGSRGMTREGTFRPDQMATELGGDDSVKTSTGVGSQVQQQLFTSPSGTPTANVQDANDIATMGRNAVVAQNRSGLTDTAGVMYALKKIADMSTQAFGTAGGLGVMALAGRGLSDPDFIDAVRGRSGPLVSQFYPGVPAATQNILQYQNNPPADYDPLGYSVTANQNQNRPQ